MGNTTHSEVGTFAAAVRQHRNQLQKSYENQSLHVGIYDDDEALRVRATAAQRFVVNYSVAGTIGFFVGLGLLGLGLLFADTVSSSDSSAGPMIGAVFGCAVWGGFCYLGSRFTRSGRQTLNGQTGGFLRVFNEAASELRKAAERGVPDAEDALKSTDAMRAGLEELFDEHQALSGALSWRPAGVYQSEYREKIEAQLREVTGVILDVCAEVSAAAGVMFASRDDLLVELTRREDVKVEVRTTLLTEAGQKTLAEARRVLADTLSER